MEKILIKNGTIIDPFGNINEKRDLYIENGIIVGKFSNTENVEAIDANDLVVTPGFVDLHVHFRDPGQTHKEDIESGLKSAVKGGFTTVCTMPNTVPTIDNAEHIHYQFEKAKQYNLAKILPVSAITKGLEGKEIVDFAANKLAGAVAFSDDGKSVYDMAVLIEAFKIASQLNIPIFSHCEDLKLVNGGQIGTNASKRLGVKPICNQSEFSIVERDINLAIKHNTRLHICHISTKESVELVRQVRKTHKNLITAEVSPHHIMLCENDIISLDANYKMSPPLRSVIDREACVEGIFDDTITVIATDHAPHAESEKAQEFEKAPNGIIGLETALGVALSILHHNHKLPLAKTLSLLNTNPAGIIGLSCSLEQGDHANITIIDPNKLWTPTKENTISKSKNSPFFNRELKGKVIYTIHDGRVVYRSK
jgi:dihydroorotase